MANPDAVSARAVDEPPWVLRISVPLRLPQDVALRPGVTIGHDARCTAVLREPGVRDVHASVARRAEGNLVIRCQPPATLTLPDGSAFDELAFAPGVTFRMGDVATCQILYDPVPLAPVAVKAIATDPGRGTPPADACPRCAASFAALASTARFCPRCGFERRPREGGPVGTIPPTAMAIESPAASAWPQGTSADPSFHSVMLLGYANAMNRLGHRYESGWGVLKNDREAVRCFFKAAQLGNEHAQERLAQRGLAPTPDTRHPQE